MTLIANLRHAAWNRETVTIGGGEFGPAELSQAAEKLEQHAELVAALERLACHVLHYASMPKAHGDAAKDAASARAVIKKAKETA